jgi:hypothetical protein
MPKSKGPSACDVTEEAQTILSGAAPPTSGPFGSGLHVGQRAEGTIDRGKHSGRGLDRKALLKCIDESACDGIDAGNSVRNNLRILVDTR